MPTENDPPARRAREVRYGNAMRLRLPLDAEDRIAALARRAYREQQDQVRYLVMLGLETEERRQQIADRALARREADTD